MGEEDEEEDLREGLAESLLLLWPLKTPRALQSTHVYTTHASSGANFTQAERLLSRKGKLSELHRRHPWLRIK